MRPGSSDALLDADEYHTATQGYVVQLVNKVLTRFGSQSVIRRLLNRRGLGTETNLLLTHGQRSRANAKHGPGITTPAALLASTPVLGESASLLSGFTTFMNDTHLNEQSPVTETDVECMRMSPPEFDAMVRDTPKELVVDVLEARKDEYGEHLRALEKRRKDVVKKLEELDDRIMQAVRERKSIEEQLQQVQHKRKEQSANVRERSAEHEEHSVHRKVRSVDLTVTVEDVSDEETDMYEADDARRLRKLTQKFVGHYGPITALSSDTTLGLVASGSVDTQVRIWDMHTGSCQHTISGHTDIIRKVQFYDRFLLTASNDTRIRMWDLALLDSVTPQPSGVETTSPPMTPTLFRRVAPQELCCDTTFVGHTDAVTCFQAMGGTMVSGSADATVREWDVASGVVRQTIDVKWATGDKQAGRVDRMASYTQGPVGYKQGPASYTQGQISETRGTDDGDGGSIGAVQFFEYALATGTSDGIVRLWDLRTSQAHRQMHGHTAPITSLQFDERTIVTGSIDTTCVLWDLRMGRELHRLKFGNTVGSVQLGQNTARSAHAAQVWVAARDRSIYKYLASSMQQIEYATDFGVVNARLEGGEARVTRVQCVESDVLLSGDDEGVVKMWNI
ncbi:Mitochondrial fission protein [Coemansia sp. RSA 2522]|nr:Mitochondrial fission protein [Coemansia sp. RSA 1938]KAJ2276339.1 Mitochondrial fission protein [Coemansia sp. RSA 370]KAJ2433149.1 Mitochondrial fission protein [Coemansia sp. RSA 2522]KAJ2591548.1 Mitochondrial fission protein [Coemansia sp. RSA 1797]